MRHGAFGPARPAGRAPGTATVARRLACAVGALALTLAGSIVALSQVTGAAPDKVIGAGKLVLDGRAMRCGGAPTLMSRTFWDYGGSHRGMIILNPTKLETLTPAVRLFVYEHECGHQIYGPSELKADCHAVERGRRAGWLTAEGMREICAFFGDDPGDWVHPPGPKRCEYVMRCFERTRPPRAAR